MSNPWDEIIKNMGEGKAPKSIEGKRVCCQEGCNTILSKYNLDGFCFQHIGAVRIKTRDRYLTKGKKQYV